MPATRLQLELLGEALRFLSLYLRSDNALRAENVFLRRQLAMLVERGAVPRRPEPADRLVLAIASRCFAWRDALIVVKPETLVRWQRKGFRLFWRWKSRAGRSPLGRELRELIRTMARENPSWGQERVADELLVKLGIRVSPRTVRKYWPPELRPRRGRRRNDQRWATFLENHARGLVACDFVVVATLRFQLLYVLVVMEPGSRRILHTNVTAHPTAGWTSQQLRHALDPAQHTHLLHDRDSIFSAGLDAAIGRLGLTIVKSPPRSPKANAFCERLIGTLRRECLDWIIPLGENHLRQLVIEWSRHYNRQRPHQALGPATPEHDPSLPLRQKQRRDLRSGVSIVTTPVLGGLHHDYRYADAA